MAAKKKETEIKAEAKVDLSERRIVAHHGENLKHYRNLIGYTQEYMATKLDISQPRYHEIEKMVEIPDETLLKCADILDLGIQWLAKIPILRGGHSYHQDGNGNTNFQNTGDVHYAMNYPVEQLAAAYQDNIAGYKENNKLLKELLEDERGKNTQLHNQYIELISKVKLG